MKKGTILLVLTALAVAATAVSCKKSEPEIPSLEGTVKFSIPPFVRKGQVVKTSLSGAVHPEGKGFGYRVTIPVISSKSDTVKYENDAAKPVYEYEFVVPDDTLGTFSVTATAFASGYAAESQSKYFTIVDPSYGQTLTDTGILPGDDKVIDNRNPSLPDGEKDYYYTSVGGMDWFRNNLGYYPSGDPSFGIPYADCEVNSYVLGRFYTWDEAVSACPEGWDLPTEADWIALAKSVREGSWSAGETIPGVAGSLMVYAKFNEGSMWEFWPAVKVTNETGLGILSAGYGTRSTVNTFSGINEYAAFWTATEDPSDPSKAYYRYVYAEDPDLKCGSADKESFIASVRCVRK